MITRPLDLISRLRPPPRNLDALAYVNVGALVLYFALFGSRFVISPGLGLDYRLPDVDGARAGGAPASCYVSVGSSGQIFTEDGPLDLAQLRDWLRNRALRDRHPSLLVRASADVSLAEITAIEGAAHAAGFSPVVVAANAPEAKGAGAASSEVLP